MSSTGGSLWSGRAGSLPYSSELGVHAGELLVGSWPSKSPEGFTSVRSLIVSDSHAHVIQSFVWPAPLASPPSPDTSGETDTQQGWLTGLLDMATNSDGAVG